MKTQRIIFALVFLAVSTAVFIGCKKDADENGTTAFNVRMTDSPGDYQEVNVHVIGAEVHSDVDGWVSLNVTPAIYNLLELTNGVDTLIATGMVPVGNVSQFRLILGTDNSVKINDQIYPLSTPSADQSGLKIQIHAELVKDIAYTFILDFDAAKSIVETGGGNYKLKPVIRAITTAVSGGIKGVTMPLAAQPAIYAIMGTDTFGTYADTTTGAYLIKGLAAGNYQVVVMPKFPYQDTTFTPVPVTLGVITDMDTVTVQP